VSRRASVYLGLVLFPILHSEVEGRSRPVPEGARIVEVDVRGLKALRLVDARTEEGGPSAVAVVARTRYHLGLCN
jgi:hypothetical protein